MARAGRLRSTVRTSFDGAGIAPTIPVPIFPPADRAHFRDAALERAVALLR